MCAIVAPVKAASEGDDNMVDPLEPHGGTMPKSKVCTRCGRRRPVEQFGPSERYADGLRPHCTPCRVEMTREWRRANRRVLNTKRRAYEALPEVKARRLARIRRKQRRLAA